jgi:acyl carrier protein
MTREDVLEVVTRHLVDTIEELDGVEIDPAKSMKDLGANSLDIVEVVSCSMRELKVKVPRSELNKLENINQLVDLLHVSVKEKDQAAS